MYSKKPSNFNLNVFLKAVLIMLLDVAATAASFFLGLARELLFQPIGTE